MLKFLRQYGIYIDFLMGNNTMKIAIHQLYDFPWLGYLEKIAQVDAFVFLLRPV